MMRLRRFGYGGDKRNIGTRHGAGHGKDQKKTGKKWTSMFTSEEIRALKSVRQLGAGLKSLEPQLSKPLGAMSTEGLKFLKNGLFEQLGKSRNFPEPELKERIESIYRKVLNELRDRAGKQYFTQDEIGTLKKIGIPVNAQIVAGKHFSEIGRTELIEMRANITGEMVR